MEIRSPSSESSSEVLKRIQDETNRVRRRLTNDSDHRSPQKSDSYHSRGSYNQPIPHNNSGSSYQHPAFEIGPDSAVTEIPAGGNSSSAAFQQRRSQQRQQEFLLVDRDTGTYNEDPVPANQMSTHLKSEHEAFRARLVDEVLGRNAGNKVPMEKVVMIIWQFRDDPQVVKFMTRFVAKFAGSRDVFDGIEFYLPQLAHMIIHLEAEWDDAVLERFALVIAQQSLHFALQLNWILQGAIEDYRPELPDGTVNPKYNPLFYSRCVKLLTNMERCVVYRKPRSMELHRLYEKGKITKEELQILEQADRRFNALQITGAIEDTETFGGLLLYKRTVRTACYKTKPWKTRYFSVEERMFNCYNSKGGRLVRSMPLEGATVEIIKDHPKYKHLFLISNQSFEFRCRAASPEDMTKWVDLLKEEANTTAVFGHMDANVTHESEAQTRVVNEMTPAQRGRYEFFRDERDFIRRVTDIAEELRFKEPADRKKIAPNLMKHMNVAPCVYSPLCNSTDIWRRVHGTFYKDTKVFNTNERCPIIMHFLAVRGESLHNRTGDANLDVAEYMHVRFDIKDDSNIPTVQEEGEDDEEEQEQDEKKQEQDEKKAEAYEDEPSKIVSSQGEVETETSAVWHDSIREHEVGSPTSGNRHLNRFLRDSFVSIPRKLAQRIEKPRRPSKLDSATGLNSVPILEGEQADDLSVTDGISVGQSSVMNNDTILIGGADEGDIDRESMDRAKKVVSGGESWAEKSKRMLQEAKFGPSQGQLEVVSMLAKSNDDLRQEVFIMQMIHYYKSVFAKAKLPIWLKTYRILSTSSSTGLIEVLVDATSLDGLKKSDNYPEEGGLRKYFEETYGGPNSNSFKAAQRNFMHSLAGYSIISYLLGLKDRHNGNIMLDTRGRITHIDFGFVMGMAPGNEFSMERAPFKLTKEYVEVMGGFEDECYKEFERLFVEGFKEARRNSQIALGLVEIMMYKSNYPCFTGKYGNGVSLRKFENRLMLNVPENAIEKRAKGLIKLSYSHWGTNAYDGFQKWSNGYAI